MKNPSENYGIVPHSELAMCCGIAGKPILAWRARSPWIAEIEVEGKPCPISGTHGEVLSWEIRDSVFYRLKFPKNDPIPSKSFMIETEKE